MAWKRSPVRSRPGGPGRDRTGDLFHAMEARSQLRHRPTLRRESAHTSGAIFILSQPRSLVKPGARLTSANQFTLRQPYSWNNSASGGVYFTKPHKEMRLEKCAAANSGRLWVKPAQALWCVATVVGDSEVHYDE